MTKLNPTASAVLYGTSDALRTSGDAYVTKLNTIASGPASLVWSTYLGGNDYVDTRAIAMDRGGNVYVTGETQASDLATPGAAQTIYTTDQDDAFVMKISVPGRVVRYTYDGLQRLIGADERPGNLYAYGYDNAGNRTSVTVNGGTPAITTYNAGNQITNAGFSYDNAGNLLNDGTAAYTYDALGRTTVRGGTSYVYNGDGTLVSQATSGVTTRYTQDLAAPLSQVLQTKVGSAAITDYIYGMGRLASLNSSVKTWYAADALGSVRRTVTDAGMPLGVINYDPWGTPESGTVPTFGFTGEIQDVGAGLVNLRARWYSTSRGRFTSVDPFAGVAEMPYSQHQYQYGYSDPVLYSDPSGRDPWWIDPDFNRSPNEPRRQDTARKRDECSEVNYFNTISVDKQTTLRCFDPETDAAFISNTASLALDFSPAGPVKGLIEIVTGCDLVTGNDLGNWRYLGLLGIFSAIKVARGLRGITKVAAGAAESRFISNKAVQLTGLGEAEIDTILLRDGWQKGQQTGGFNAGEPLWWKEISGVRHEVRLHPHASPNPNLPADATAKYGGVSRYGVELVKVPRDAKGRAPVPGSPQLREVYEMDRMLRQMYGDAPSVMPRYDLHYLDPFGYAYVDEAGNLTPVAANGSHFPIKGHPWLAGSP